MPHSLQTNPTAEPIILGISGGSASGKSTLCASLAKLLPPGTVAYLPQDAYYRSLHHLSIEERRQVNFDAPHSVDFRMYVDHIQSLRAGNSIQRPFFDYILFDRLDASETVESAPVILLDGIFILAEPRVRDLMTLSIYLDASPDLRLARRVQKDTKELGRPLDWVLRRYELITEPAYQEVVAPSMKYADMVWRNTNKPDMLTLLILGFLQNRLRL